jgi:branched-chain amino acid transport system permease protein
MQANVKGLKGIPQRVGYLREQGLVLAIFIVVMMLVPLGVGLYPVTVMVDIGIYAIITLGLVLLMGLAGQISLGHAAFFGCGAYFSAILTTRYQFPPWGALFLAALFTGAIAAFVGRCMFRLHGLILAGVTLALNLVFFYLVGSLTNVTGGAIGIMEIPPLSLGPFDSRGLMFNYYLVWIIAILLLVFSLNLTSSRSGRALRAINAHAGGSEEAAQVLGVNVMRYKVWALVLSAVYASLAGSVYAHYVRIIEPGTFTVQLSAMVALMAIIGGRASPWGAFLGAGLIVAIRQVLREALPSALGSGISGSYELIAYGVILAVALLFLPDGLVSVIRRRTPRKVVAR